MKGSKAFVIGSDRNQLDLAHKVMGRLDRVTSYPVIFNYGEKGWFDKPAFISKALLNYDQVCWLDNDIQILRNFDEIFELAGTSCISGVPNFLYPFCLNAGVLVFNRSAFDTVLTWQFVLDTFPFRSDQEALQHIRQDIPEKFFELPMEYNHQKFAIKSGNSINDKTAIVHWTGDDGKEYLRSS